MGPVFLTREAKGPCCRRPDVGMRSCCRLSLFMGGGYYRRRDPVLPPPVDAVTPIQLLHIWSEEHVYATSLRHEAVELQTRTWTCMCKRAPSVSLGSVGTRAHVLIHEELSRHSSSCCCFSCSPAATCLYLVSLETRHGWFSRVGPTVLSSAPPGSYLGSWG